MILPETMVKHAMAKLVNNQILLARTKNKCLLDYCLVGVVLTRHISRLHSNGTSHRMYISKHTTCMHELARLPVSLYIQCTVIMQSCHGGYYDDTLIMLPGTFTSSVNTSPTTHTANTGFSMTPLAECRFNTQTIHCMQVLCC